MATTHTITGSIADWVPGVDPRRVRAVAYLNIPATEVVVEDSGKVWTASKAVNIDTALGTFAAELLATDATDLNVEPGTLRWTIQLSVVDQQTRLVGRTPQADRRTVTLGPFPVTADGSIGDLTEHFDTPAVSPQWRSTFAAEMEDVRTQAVSDVNAIKADVEAAETAVAADRAYVENLVVTDLGTTDGQTKALIESPSSQTAGALSAAIGALVDPLGGARQAAAGIRASLDAGVTTGLAVIGDSTGNQSNEWPHLIGQHVAAQHPEYTVQHVLWDDLAGTPALPPGIETDGGGWHFNTNAVTTSFARPLGESPHTPAVLDVRAQVKMADWTPTNLAVFAGREGGAGKRSWYFGLAPNGRLGFYYSIDGSTMIIDKISSAVVPAADGATLWVRAVYTPSTHLRYYTSTDGAAWTQLGIDWPITDGALFDAATPYELGGRQGSTFSNTARIYAVDIRNGLDGTPIVPTTPFAWAGVSGGTGGDMSAPTIIQTGTAGLQYLDTASSIHGRSLTLAQSPHTSGVLDARVKVRLADWTPTNAATLISREGGAGKRSWYMIVTPAGKIGFYYSTDGSTLITDKVSSAIVPAADGATIWVRAVYTPSESVKFYTSTDGNVWTQLGATMTHAHGALFNAATPYELGSRQGATQSNTAHIFDVDVRDGLNGTPIVPRLPALWGAVQGNAAAVVGAPTFTVVNGSHPGATLTYWSEAYVKKALPQFGQRLAFASIAHNQEAHSGPDFQAGYSALLARIKARMPGVPLVAVTQNPQVSPRLPGFVQAQTTRRVDIFTAASSAGAAVIDTYQAFVDAGTSGNIEASDGVHPTPAGSIVWRDKVVADTGL